MSCRLVRIPLILSLALALPIAPAAAQELPARKVALLVGVKEYAHHNLSALRYTENDVTELAVLLKKGGYEVTILCDSLGKQDPALAPTKANIEKHFKRVLALCTDRHDAVLLAFAGHGLQFDGHRDAFFCPSDAKPFAEQTATLVSLAQVFNELEQSYAGAKLLLVDACRSDPKLGRGVNGDNAPRATRGVGVLFSCAAGERAWEHEKYQHGIFFHFVLEGLRGKAKNSKGLVTFTSLSDYVSTEVAQTVEKLIGEGAKQSPNMRAEFVGPTPLLLAPAAVEAALLIRYALIAPSDASRWDVPLGRPQVNFVVPGGGGDVMGLRAGDVILRVGGRDVNSPRQVFEALKDLTIGARLEMVVLRDGKLKMPLSGAIQSDFDSAEELRRVQKLADQPAAQSWIALMYELGRGVTKDEAESARWFRKAADAGDTEAQTYLGQMYERGRGVTKDAAQATQWYRKAAEQGHAVAQHNLGVAYANGNGVGKDETEAAAWYAKAAAQGHAAAQHNLARMYAHGRGVPKDEAAAVRWYSKAAAQGYVFAQHNLALMYANGRGAAKDEARAAHWYARAAEQGYVDAQINLGWMHENGRGVTKDEAEAVKWYRKAADTGNAIAQTNLGVMYERGSGGLRRDAEEAAHWYRKAAAQGHVPAEKALKRLGQS
jgi:TPR repeat protein